MSEENLGLDIMINAIFMYRQTLKGLIKTKKDIENFFNSDFGYVILQRFGDKYDAEYIMKNICNQAGYTDDYKMNSDLEVYQDYVNNLCEGLKKVKCKYCHHKTYKNRYCGFCGKPLKIVI